MARRAPLFLSVVTLVALALVPLSGSPASGAGTDSLSTINHIVVIYEENHSFDNLYGGWEGVRGRAGADAFIQVNQAGLPFQCLKQDDVNLTSPPLKATCTDTTTGTTFTSHFQNVPFQIDTYIPATARTCPQPGVFAPNGLTPSPSNLPGGCTRYIVHRFYLEQYRLDGGLMAHYTTGSAAVGISQG